MDNLKAALIYLLVSIFICFLLFILSFSLYNFLTEKEPHPLINPTTQETSTTKKEEFKTRTIFYELGEFTVNLADVGTSRFLKLGIGLEILDSPPQNKDFMMLDRISDFHKKKMLEKYMSKHSPKIKDAIISILSSKTKEQLLRTDGKELLRDEILNEVNLILNGEKEVVQVEFNPFIMQ